MNGNSIKIIIEAEGLSRAMAMFAEALTQYSLNAVASQDSRQVIKPRIEWEKNQEKKEVKENQEVEKAITLEEVRKILATKSKNGKQAEVKELIKIYGVNKLTDIHSCNYKELIEFAEEI